MWPAHSGTHGPSEESVITDHTSGGVKGLRLCVSGGEGGGLLTRYIDKVD